jgi:hypothetical protein
MDSITIRQTRNPWDPYFLQSYKKAALFADPNAPIKMGDLGFGHSSDDITVSFLFLLSSTFSFL